ncbi:MAG: thiaminase II [Thermocladium sp.]|jgi:thiaminase/transcriptional activator TenA
MLTAELWASIKDIYNSIINHPFIKGLVDGSLEEDKFKFYIVQDHLYLREFSRAVALASAKARNEREQSLFASHITDALNVERNLHGRYLSLWGIDIDEYRMSPTNLAYTSYLLSTAYSRPYHEVLAALLPCYWIYMEVGKELMKHGSPNKLYNEWINTYGGDAYEAGVRAVLNIVDSMELTKEEKINALTKFRIASIYEYMFWDSAYRMEKFSFDPWLITERRA